MRLLKHEINSFMRDYFIEKVNAPLVKAIIILAGRYPEPTYENVNHPNSQILLDIEEEFFKHWSLRAALCKALWRMLIVKYEHSPQYRNMLDWFLMMLIKSNWKQWNPNRQMVGWKS